MKLDAGVEALPSVAGVIFSVLLTIDVLGYAAQKLEILINKKDVDIMSVLKKDYFSEDQPFQYEQGLEFAEAFTAYDQETDIILDPSIGRIVYETYEFGYDDSIYERYT